VLAIALIATAGALFVLLKPSSANPIGGAAILRQTQWGPVDNDDRTLLVKVLQAGLWERPTALQAAERGGSERVKEVGPILAEDHLKLSAEDRALAAKLGVGLPSRPTADQQRWMTELAGKSGADYDRTWVLRLRAAHGKVFAAIAQVRSTTANSLIRQFADHCQDVVLKHMTLLESTGLVNFREARH
jgi:putative membrane protein